MRRFHETVFGIYFDDLDPFSILHNARYLLLFERALGAFWMDVGWGAFQDSERPEQFHLVRQNSIEYLSPVRGVGKVRVRVGVDRADFVEFLVSDAAARPRPRPRPRHQDGGARGQQHARGPAVER
ncbi:MAG TPA: hotdog domain-containing protein [Enhygromyxa sp.]|nr:hotdog domain-containing protein [Enhygromyxa sp.]